MLVKAKCILCGEQSFVAEYRLGGAGCDKCLQKNGLAKPRPNRGLLKKRRIQKDKP